MNPLKLNKYAAIFSAGLFLISIVVAGWDNPKVSNFGEDLIIFSLGIYLPFYCLRSIHLGKVHILGYAETVSKEKQTALFWFLIVLIILLAISAMGAPFK